MKIPRTKLKYYKETRYIIKKKKNYKSIMQVPKLTKICINQGIGSAVSDKKLIKIAIEEITAITGQKAIATKSKTSISNFKLRENMKIGVKVTLRRNKMYEFYFSCDMFLHFLGQLDILDLQFVLIKIVTISQASEFSQIMYGYQLQV